MSLMAGWLGWLSLRPPPWDEGGRGPAPSGQKGWWLGKAGWPNPHVLESFEVLGPWAGFRGRKEDGGWLPTPPGCCAGNTLRCTKAFHFTVRRSSGSAISRGALLCCHLLTSPPPQQMAVSELEISSGVEIRPPLSAHQAGGNLL